MDKTLKSWLHESPIDAKLGQVLAVVGDVVVLPQRRVVVLRRTAPIDRTAPRHLGQRHHLLEEDRAVVLAERWVGLHPLDPLLESSHVQLRGHLQGPVR